MELLRFRLLRLMAASGIKAKVLGGFLSSKRLLAGNVVELVTMKMRKKYKNCIVQDVDYLDHMPFDRDGHHATGYEVKIDGFWDYDYEE